MPRGRKKGFSPKQIAGLPLSDQAEATRLGNVAVTRGAKLAKKIAWARLLKNQADLAAAAGELAEAMKSDPAVLREMAEFAESGAAARSEKGGDAAWSLVAHYLLLFEAVRTGDDTSIPAIFDVPEFSLLLNHMKAELQKNPLYRPGTTEVWDYLEKQMEDACPDRRTVQTMMRTFGYSAD